MDELMYLLLRTQKEARNLSLEFNSNNKFERVAVALEKIYLELIGIMAENDPRRKAVDNLKTLVV